MKGFRLPATTGEWARTLPAVTIGPVAVTLLAIPEELPPVAVVTALYLLGVVIAARLGGAGAGIGASLLSFLLLNFFFTDPLHTFAVGTSADLVALVVFLISALVVGLLFSSERRARSQAEQRELEARLLNQLATRLLSGEPTELVLDGFARGVQRAFGFAGCEVTTSFDGEATSSPIQGDVPLLVRGHEIGVLRFSLPQGRDRLTDEERRSIDSLATQLALALEGVRLSSDIRRAELDAHSSELKAALFSGVTHDVKTPLAAIMTSVTSLLDGTGFSEFDQKEHLETIKQEAERLHRVVNNLLDIARVQAGSLVPTRSLSPIDEVMESVVGRLHPLLSGRQVDIRVGEEVPPIPMDVVQIDQLLTNLVENAIKFSPVGTPIYLSAVGGPDRVRVTVTDRGPGVKTEDRARIFEPFERASGSGSGTGLGLAIARAIAIAHGGRIWVAETPAGGAAFTFELPCRFEDHLQEPQDVGSSSRSR